jgi:hypothetical protein
LQSCFENSGVAAGGCRADADESSSGKFAASERKRAKGKRPDIAAARLRLGKSIAACRLGATGFGAANDDAAARRSAASS